MTEFVMDWVRGTWGREVLRRRIERLEDMQRRSIELLKTLKETNIAQSRTILEIEERNGVLEAAVKAWEDASARIDPNAKCPVCGDMKGHLTHIAKVDRHTGACTDVICQNNCETCGNKFISAEPVAGRERAAQLYQPDIAPKIILPENK
jgi:hypothetical protein